MLFSTSQDSENSTFKNTIAPDLSFIFALLDIHVFMFKLVIALYYGIYAINYISILAPTPWGSYTYN